MVAEHARCLLIPGEGGAEVGRLAVAAHLQERHALEEARGARVGRRGVDASERVEGGRPLSRLELRPSQREAGLDVAGVERQGLVEQLDAGRGIGGGKTLGVGAERLEGHGPPKGLELLASARRRIGAGKGDVPGEGVNEVAQAFERPDRDERRGERGLLDVEEAEREPELRVGPLVGADEKTGSAQGLGKADRGGAARLGSRGQAQGLLGPEPIAALHRGNAEQTQGARQAVGYRLGDPGGRRRGRRRRLRRGDDHHSHRRCRQQEDQRAHAGSSIRAGGRTQACAPNSLRSRKPSDVYSRWARVFSTVTERLAEDNP